MPASKFPFFLILLFSAIVQSVSGASGDLDLSFGEGGKVITAIGTADDQAYGVVVQSDGKVLVAGSAVSGATTHFALVRYLEDGSLDTGFGTGGKVITAFENSQSNDGRSVVLQEDGKILVGGGVYTQDTYGFGPTPSLNFAIARYHADGSTDTSFGKNGQVITAFSFNKNEVCQSLVLQKDGRIVAVGNLAMSSYPASDFAIVLARYEPDGSPDMTFGRGGRLMFSNLPTYTEFPVSVAIQDDGKVLVTGTAGQGGYDVLLLRYNTDGTLDDTFGYEGQVTTNFTIETGHSLVVQGDGKILVTGSAPGTSAVVYRYLPDGNIDMTFGTNGRLKTSAASAGYALKVQADGRILIAGQGAGEFALLRLTSAGVLDATFGTGGVVTTDIGSGDSTARSLAILPNGQVMAVGYANNGSDNDFAIVRYVNAVAPAVSASLPTNVTATAATLNGVVDAQGQDTAIEFEISADGLNYTSVAAAPGIATGSDATPVSAEVDELAPDLTYRFRVKATNGAGTTVSAVQTFAAAVPSSDASLSGLAVSDGILGPAFSSDMLTYTVTVPVDMPSIRVTPAAVSAGAVIRVNGIRVEPGQDSGVIQLAMGNNTIVVDVTAADAVTTRQYQVSVKRESPVTGLLDPAFGANGKVLTAMGTSGDLVKNVVVQSDGKILVGGVATGTPAGHAAALARYHPDGSLDFGFGNGGRIITSIRANIFFGDIFTVQSDGKIVVAGYTTATDADFAVLRFNANGTPDTTFGTGGQVVTPVGSAGDYAESVAVRPDGKIVVSGLSLNGSINDAALVRYHANGSLDTTFGVGGKMIAAGAGHADCVLLQEDGKILTHYFGAMRRYLSDGGVDTSFGNNGMVSAVGMTDGNMYSSRPIAIQPDGKILRVAGVSSGLDEMLLAVTRYLPNGTPDPSFGIGGKAWNEIVAGTRAYGEAVAVQNDGKIVVAGICHNGTNTDFAVARFDSDGEIDSSFGVGGRIVTPFGAATNDAYAVAVQKDGKVVVGGNAFNGSNYDFALVRYASAPLPLVNTLPSVDLSAGGVTVRGTVSANENAGGGSTQVWFEYWPDGGELTSIPATPGVITGSAFRTVSATISGLTEGVNYKFRVKAASSVGTSAGNLESFVAPLPNGTPYGPEIAVESPGGAELASGGTWAFAAHQAGLDKSVSFKVRNDGNVSLEGIGVTLEGANAAMFGIVGVAPENLESGQEMAVQVRYASGTTGQHTALLRIKSNDDDEPFFDVLLKGTGRNAQAVPVKTLVAAAVSFQGATLRGTIQPKDTAPEVWFEYGLTASYGQIAAVTPSTIMGDQLTEVSVAVTGLQPHTQYDYRLRSLGSTGEATAAGMTFTTGNREPVAANDTFVVVPGGTVSLNVLSNDADADGDALSLASHTTTPAAQGKVAKVSGALVFTASASFSGGASFQYGVKDGFGGTATGTVTLTLGTSGISPAAKDVGSGGGAYTVVVTGTGGWSVVETLPWVTVSPVSQSGNGVVGVTVQPHAGKTARTGKVLIAGKEHVITQAGVQFPSLGVPAVPQAIVSGYYEMVIPTTNAPVTYTVTNLPPGLAINQATGVISGKPNKAGTFAVKVQARNAAGAAPEAREFDIVVEPLAEGLTGAFHGLVSGDADVNGWLGSRFEMTTTTTGAVSGRIITGVTAVAFTGRLDASVADMNQAGLIVSLPRRGGSALSLALTLNGTANAAAGTLGGVPVTAWRQVWRAVTMPATVYKGAHSFFLAAPDAGTDIPQGHGFGFFSVNEKTGALKVSGKLADGSAVVTATFMGPNGQVLLYQPLYANKGSLAGMLSLGLNHGITGAPLWYKPEAATTSKETVYRAGLGPVEYFVTGGDYATPAAGGRVLNLPNQEGNALLAFEPAGTDADFSIGFSLLNPGSAGIKQTAAFPLENPNKVKLTTIDAATGFFAGEFTLAGIVPAQNRKAGFQGQIVRDGAEMRGYGFFVLPEPANLGTSLFSGAVYLEAAPAP